MAEDQETTDNAQDLTADEKAELESRLDDTGGGEKAAGGLKGLKAKFQKILSNKKLLMIYGGGLLVLIIAIGVGAYFFLGEKEADVVPLEEQTEERIKKEILTASNALLLGGTGTITDVFFTRFMVK